MPSYELANQVAIVSGAGQGMGRAIALRLTREGAAVAVADIDNESAMRVAAEIEAQDGAALALQVDVTSRADTERMVAECADRFGRLNIMVNNAGVLAVTPVLELDDSAWDWQMNVNAKGVLYCSQAAARQMIAQGEGGRIITIASTAGKIPSGKDVPIAGYVASKHAAVGLTKQMALELARYDILVNCVFPGIVESEMLQVVHGAIARLEGVPEEEIRARALATVPLSYFQSPQKVANMVAFLCSTDSDYSVGSVFDVTGGAFPYY
ncbi:MAG: SDR family NAD(P)-dependent oxidoreductase [Caldilineaceae bacterium]|nr:SDR family NAD(P)-dependent oxidoreductase [Caldilineaceae bacterium]